MMNLNNYNAANVLPTDFITGDVIPFGEDVVLVFDESLMLAKEVIPSASMNKPFNLTPTWWKNHVDLDRISLAAKSGQLKWEAQTDDIFGEVYATSL